MRHVLNICLLAVAFCLLGATAQAQDGKLEINHLDRLTDRATEAVEISLNEAQMRYLARLMMTDRRSETGLIGLFGKLSGVYVRGFEFDKPGEFSAADLNALRAQLRGPGWQRLADVRERNGEQNEIYVLPGKDAIVGWAAISTEPQKLCVINILGPLDLTELSAVEKEFKLSKCGQGSSQTRRLGGKK